MHWKRLLLACLLIPYGNGCQKQEEQPAATVAAVTTSAAPTAPAPQGKVDPAHPELRWIGEIPYDVFYDQPLSVAADMTPVAGTEPANTVASTTAPAAAMPATPAAPAATPAAPASSADSAAVDWGTLAPMDAISDEVKQIRVRLEKNLLKVGDFNKNTAQISQDGALMAAIADVIARHPESVNWKEKAPFVRDLATQIYTKAEGTGSKPFNATKAPFEELKRLLDGEAPAGEAPAAVPLAESADRSALMNRLSAVYESVKSNTNTAERLKEDKEKVLRELAIMNLMMAVMGDHSYDQASDPRYARYVAQMLDAQRAAAEAARAEQFDPFTAALSKINVTCAECHTVFRGSE